MVFWILPITMKKSGSLNRRHFFVLRQAHEDKYLTMRIGKRKRPRQESCVKDSGEDGKTRSSKLLRTASSKEELPNLPPAT